MDKACSIVPKKKGRQEFPQTADNSSTTSPILKNIALVQFHIQHYNYDQLQENPLNIFGGISAHKFLSIYVRAHYVVASLLADNYTSGVI